MPRETYSDGEILTDDIGRLWMVLAPGGRGLLMPELPEFLATVEGEDAKLPGFEFVRDQASMLERERCAKAVESMFVEGDHLTGVWSRKAATVIRSGK